MAKTIRPKYLKNQDPWLLGEEIPDSDIFFFQIPFSYFTNDRAYSFLRMYKKSLTHFKKFHMHFYVGDKDSFEVAENIVDELVKRKGLGADINRNIAKWSNELIRYAKETTSLPLHEFSNKQLWERYLQHDTIHTKLYTYGWLPVAIDLFHNNFTQKLKSYLYQQCPSKEGAEKAFVILTTPSKKTIIAEEREAFLKLYKKYFKQLTQPGKEFMDKLLWHASEWGHLGYTYAGNVTPFGPEHYLKEMRELVTSKINADTILKKEQKQLKQAYLNQTALYKKYAISRKYQELFTAAQGFALTKLIRRHAQLLDLHNLHRSLLAEISKRLKTPRHIIQFMLKGEIKDALLNKKMPGKKFLDTRFKECILYTEKGFEHVYSGQEAKKLAKVLVRDVDINLTELVGQTAQPGFARGTVKLIFRAKDMAKFNKGDILVSIATDPDVVPAMKRAAAIITEQGGITSHAAIVSRELGVPCVIGTKIATKILKDGDIVEVDATKGVIKKL